MHAAHHAAPSLVSALSKLRLGTWSWTSAVQIRKVKAPTPLSVQRASSGVKGRFLTLKAWEKVMAPLALLALQ
jgi:hypothetical protein